MSEQNDIVRAALEAVEWSCKAVNTAGEHGPSCPICGAFQWCGHDADCLIGRALASRANPATPPKSEK
jgi:hypothetical protein